LRNLAILGTRGVPGAHGGFETFAERLALYLVERDWAVTVYCQEEGNQSTYEDTWRGVRRIVIPVAGSDAKSTVVFDWHATRHAAREEGVKLVLGYNTAVFNALLRLRFRPTVTNMDGIEWRRDKWGLGARAWFYVNERLGCLLSHHLVADHPEIGRHLRRCAATSKITMIPYGARDVRQPDPGPLASLGVESGQYAVVIARPEPENSILQIVSAYARRNRPYPLVVLGNYDPGHPYQRRVQEVAGEQVIFPGAIYETDTVDCLRGHAAVYVHGHTVGGTNPSLVEALGAGCPIVAHDNRFNRWVAGDSAAYFDSEQALGDIFDSLLEDRDRLAGMAQCSREQFQDRFTWPDVLAQYERLLLGYCTDDDRCARDV
jgi:glycosyltransferase involved in cell wall biosynthesis